MTTKAEYVTMDKSWVDANRLSDVYKAGVNSFLDQAFLTRREYIKCPCKKCCNRYYLVRQSIFEHLIIEGFDPGYGKGM